MARDGISSGDNVYLENCIVESRDTIRANSRYVGENGLKIIVESSERYILKIQETKE